MEVIYKEHTVRDDGTILNKHGKEVGFKNGTIANEQAKAIEELTEACKASLK